MMQRTTLFFIIALHLAVGLSFGQAQAVDNLLSNPGFEEEFVDFEGEEPRSVGAAWTPWHIPASYDSPAYANHSPHYQPAAPETSRIRSGDNAQSYFSLYATHKGGLYQQVETAESGTFYRFSIYARVWSSTFQDFEESEEPGDVALLVGIDPTGGTNGSSGDIVWSPVAAFYYDAYRQYSVIAEAQSSTITVFVMSTIETPVANSYIYLDDAALEAAAETEIALESTPTLETTPPPAQPSIQPSVQPSATPSEVPDGAIHIVQYGETLSGIASEYDSSVEAIREENDLTPADRIFPEQSLIIPFASPDEASEQTAPALTPTSTATPALHTVQAGETLDSIAERFDTTAAVLAQLNGILNPSRVRPGQSLRISIDGAADLDGLDALGRPESAARTYTVLVGDTLFELAARLGIDVAELARANGILNYHLIYPGQVLVIPE